MFNLLTTHQQKIIAHFAWNFIQFGTTDLKVWVMSDGEFIDSSELDKLVDMKLVVRFPGQLGNYGHDAYSARVTALDMGLKMFVLEGESEAIVTTIPAPLEPKQPATVSRKGRVAYPPKQKIKLALRPDSTINPEIDADIAGRFAVHVDEAAYGKQYTITHVESGYCVIPETKYNLKGRSARRIAIECAQELDNTLSQDAFYKDGEQWKTRSGVPDAAMRIIGRHAARKE